METELSIILGSMIGGVVAPLLLVLVLSGGKMLLRELLLGCGLCLFTLVLIKILTNGWIPQGTRECVGLGFLVACIQRLAIGFCAQGKRMDEAAWLGFGFGLIETIYALTPGAPIYMLFAGGALHHAYRRCMNTLFQTASAIMLSRMSLSRLVVLTIAQGAGLTLILLSNAGLLPVSLSVSSVLVGILYSTPFKSLVEHR